MEWIVPDKSFGKTSVPLDAVPLATSAEFPLRAKIGTAQPDDELIWAHGWA